MLIEFEITDSAPSAPITEFKLKALLSQMNNFWSLEAAMREVKACIEGIEQTNAQKAAFNYKVVKKLHDCGYPVAFEVWHVDSLGDPDRLIATATQNPNKRPKLFPWD